MKLIIDIDEEEYLGICDEPCTKLAYRVANGTPIPDNAKNGQIMQAMFPNRKFKKITDHNVIIGFILDGIRFDEVWWNAPYQKGGKE